MQMRFAALAAGLFVASLTFDTAQALPPVEAFGALPFIAQPQLSPDGKHFAAIQDLDGKPAAAIYTVNSPDAPQVFASTNWTVVSATWVKNDRVLLFTKASKTIPFGENPDLYTWYRAISVQVGGSDWVQLFDRLNGSVSMNSSTAVIVDKVPGDPDIILMPLWTRPKNDRIDNDVTAQVAGDTRDIRLSLYKVDVHTGRGTVIQDGGTFPAYWISDGEGGVIGRVEETRSPPTDHLLLYRDGSWKKVRDFGAGEDGGANIYGLTFDGQSLAAVVTGEDGRRAAVRLDRETGATGAVLFNDPNYDLSYMLGDDWTGRVIGAAYMADRMQYVYFDKSREDLQLGIEKVFPGLDAHAVSVTQAGDKAIVAVQGPDSPTTFYFLDRDTHVATKIASEYPALAPGDLGSMRSYPYKARDGLDIPAYLTVPPGREAKNLPLIVMPHGGPDARDGMSFNWWVQFLANRGYAVFQPNYRGSDGYGRAFRHAGFHQWGLKVQDDISDGVKQLIADGIVDPKRICIVGASYGGYAALAGATFSPGLYACAVSVAGLSDLDRLLTAEHRIHGDHSSAVAFWETRMGTDTAALDAVSPALHADQVRIPVLLMHGKLDTTVSYGQSEEERDALQRAGKSVELVTFDDDDHYMTLAATRIKMLTELERFLKANIGGG